MRHDGSQPNGEKTNGHTGEDIDPAKHHLARAKKCQGLQAESGESREAPEDPDKDERVNAGTRMPDTTFE